MRPGDVLARSQILRANCLASGSSILMPKERSEASQMRPRSVLQRPSIVLERSEASQLHPGIVLQAEIASDRGASDKSPPLKGGGGVALNPKILLWEDGVGIHVQERAPNKSNPPTTL